MKLPTPKDLCILTLKCWKIAHVGIKVVREQNDIEFES